MTGNRQIVIPQQPLRDLAPTLPVHTEVTTYALEDAPRALDDLRAGRFSGAAVVVPYS